MVRRLGLLVESTISPSLFLPLPPIYTAFHRLLATLP